METIHPAVVHFPIALLSAAFLLDTLAWLFDRPAWRRVALWNLALGSLGAIAAVLTGRQAEAVAKHSWEIHQVMELHERLGYAVLGLAVGVTGLRVFLRDHLGRIARGISWVALAVAVALMAYGAHLGGRLVYEFGVGGVYGRGTGIEVVQ